MANRYMKKCSTSLIIRKMQIQTPVRMAVFKEAKDKCWKTWRNLNPCTIGGNAKWCSHYGKQYRGFSKKLIRELPYDLAIPPSDIYPK